MTQMTNVAAMNNVDSVLQNHVCLPVYQSTFLSSPTAVVQNLET